MKSKIHELHKKTDLSVSKNEHIVMGVNGNPISSPVAIHPGEVLKDEIEARGLIKKDVARQIDLLPQHLSELFAGKRHITPAVALKLEDVLHISAEFWLTLQNKHDLTLVRNQKERKKHLAHTR